jgi:hypothetical protein
MNRKEIARKAAQKRSGKKPAQLRDAGLSEQYWTAPTLLRARRWGMSFDLTEDDDADMCRYIEQVLEKFADGEMSLREAQADPAHAMVVAAVDDEAAFKKYIRLPPAERALA